MFLVFGNTCEVQICDWVPFDLFGLVGYAYNDVIKFGAFVRLALASLNQVTSLKFCLSLGLEYHLTGRLRPVLC